MAVILYSCYVNSPLNRQGEEDEKVEEEEKEEEADKEKENPYRRRRKR